MADEKPTGHCDLCGEVVDEFIDGRMRNSQWANLCLTCWEENRMFSTLGMGVGQRYKWMLCPYRRKWGYYQMEGGRQPGLEKWIK